jgi:formylglycine-generating enzyme required for sulfatase activity
MIPDLAQNLAPEMARIPSGEFMMGESADDKFANATERPAHRIVFAEPFLLATFPITVGQFQKFAPQHALGADPTLPVVSITWYDARAFCAWLSEKAGREFRLPTEAEWEYGCRAGTTTPFHCGQQITSIDANFLHDEYCVRIGPGRLTPEGEYPPNKFGLHDMHGNVCEWTADKWRASYSPSAAYDEDRRVIRGGAWDYIPRLLRSTWRDHLPADSFRDNVGFRIACNDAT